MMDDEPKTCSLRLSDHNELAFPGIGPWFAGHGDLFRQSGDPGDKVIVCVNRRFGGRMAENVRRLGGVAVIVEDAWARRWIWQRSKRPSRPADAALLAFVRCGNPTEPSDRIAWRHGALTIIAIAGGVPVLLDDHDCRSGSQKCSVSTLRPVAGQFRSVAVARIGGRR